MADDREKGSGFSVDEILAEYGSKSKNRPKVVEFPEQPGVKARRQKEIDLPMPEDPPPPEPEEDDGLPKPPKPIKVPPRAEPDKPMAQIKPKGLRRALGARLSSLIRQADTYADHMYDEAEPSEEVKKAERYIPGTDREEEPAQAAPRPARRPRSTPKQEELPPDVEPAELAARWRKGLVSQGRRVLIAGVVTLAAIVVSLDLPFFHWDDLAESPLASFRLRALILTILLAAVGALCFDVITAAIRQVMEKKLCPELIAALAWVFTLVDGLTAGHLEDRGNSLPCSAVTAVGLVCALWGIHARQAANRVSAKVAAQARTPYVVTLDDNKWNARPAYAKRSDIPTGFGSQLQAESGPDKIYRVAAPLLILGGVLCALLASVGRGAPERFTWAASCGFTAAAAWPALLVYGLPYRRLADRLDKLGAALAGWPGVLRCGSAGIIIEDSDLFPTGAVQVSQVNVFGGVATEKVVAYTATLLRALNCGLTRPFHDLLRAQGAIYREVSGVVTHEGGVSGIIRNQEVLVGTADFMQMMDVELKPGHNIRAAVFCAINGELAGLFPLHYTLNPAVNPSLSALIRENMSPVLATRDPVIVPAMLEQKFQLPVDKLEFPGVQRRLELSDPDQDHDHTAVAILAREGLSAFCDAVLGGRRLRLAARLGLLFAIAGAALGLMMTFYLTSIGAFASLTTLNFLIFMFAWLIPELVITHWVDQF